MVLFENESIDFKSFKIKEEASLTEEQINEKYVKGDIRIVTEQARYPLNTIVSMIDKGNYLLNPDFQRRRRWDTERKSRLIESFIMNVPIPPIFLYESKFSFYEVMDGLQRLTAIYEFYTDKYKLQGLELWKEINGLNYSCLPEQVKKGIDRRYLSSIILLQETAKNKEEAERMKQLVFERLNSGGVKLEPQETRNALYDGNLNKLCIKLSRNKYLCKMWGIPEPTPEELENNNVSTELQENDSYKKMEDVELVLRFFSYRQIDRFEYPTLKEFLDYFLKKGNSFNITLLSKYEELFNNTVQFVYEVLGDTAFMLWRKRAGKWILYNRPTKVLYDPIMYIFSQNLDRKENLISKAPTISDDINKFYEVNYSEFEGRSNNRKDVLKRIDLLRKFLVKY